MPSFGSLYILLFGILSFSIFEIIMKVFKEYLSFHTDLRINCESLCLTQRKLFQKTLEFFDRYSDGDILARFQAMDSVKSYVINTPLALVVDLLFGLIFIGILFYFSTTLTSLILIFCPLFGVLSWLNGRLIKPLINKSFEIQSERNTKLIETISEIASVKSMNMEQSLENELHRNMCLKIENERLLKNLEVLFFVLSQSLERILTLLIWFLGVKAVLLNELTIGQYMVFNMFIGRVTSPIMLLMNLGKDLKTLKVNIEKSDPLFAGREEDVFKTNGSGSVITKGAIVFKDVSFSYDQKHIVLQNINLNISGGDVIGVIGNNGSGKTTFSKLIQTLYTPTSGDVFIDGTNTKACARYQFRENIGVVLQNSSLFNTTILENIRMMDTNISEERVVEIAKNIGAHHFIVGLPEKYHTEVGFKGGHLSGGQRQLIALARALIRDPKILILDEATSNLDVSVEGYLIDNFKYVANTRTVILITHNQKLLKLANKTFAFQKGNLPKRPGKATDCRTNRILDK